MPVSLLEYAPVNSYFKRILHALSEMPRIGNGLSKGLDREGQKKNHTTHATTNVSVG